MWQRILAVALFIPFACRYHAPERVLVIGNSITHHAPAPELGWHGDWGMAATTEENDWVHRVLAEMTEGAQLTLVHCTAPNLRAQANDLAARVAEARPTLLVIQVGDNMSPEAASTSTLYEPIRHIAEATTGRVLVIGVWGADDIRNTLIAAAAHDARATFVPIHDIREMDGGQAWDDFGDGPVGWHPSDLGMAMIAERVIAVIESE